MQLEFTCDFPEELEIEYWEPFTSAWLDDEFGHLIFSEGGIDSVGTATTMFECAGVLDENWNVPEIPEWLLSEESTSLRVSVPLVRESNCPGNYGYYFQPTVNGDNYQIWFTMQLLRNSGGVL